MSGKRAKKSLVLPEGSCRRFSLAEIKIATNNFDDDLVIDHGDSGKIYKGFIDDSTIKVAIRRRNWMLGQGFKEFGTVLVLHGQLRHPNLVNLIGYCTDEHEMILVYEFILGGSLDRRLLHQYQHDPLPWKRRLQICIGVARGLHYLHTGVKHTIIYRDVKLTNILLGENWEAKLADFGLCKKGPPSLSKALIRIDSVVKGTVGYLDPAYLRTSQLTDKTDVYCFGVVLFEVLCARRSVDMESEREQSMAVWAPACVEDGTINQIIDPYLIGKIAPECFKIYVDIATSCLREDNLERPAIGEVEIGLEHALELQEYADAAMRKDDVGSGKEEEEAHSMAESVVFNAVGRLGNLLIEEATYLKGVSQQVKQTQIELKRMQCFLKDADKRQNEDESVRIWVSQIREAAYEVEDVIETFALEIALKNRDSTFKKHVPIFNTRKLYKVGSKIEVIKTRISDLTRSLQTYGVTPIKEVGSSSVLDRQRQLRWSYSHVVEEYIVGLDEDIKEVVAQLVNEDKHCQVVSICGMGGLGKTTLAKKIYHHSESRLPIRTGK
uniref:Protein kinase domain-containing protein n=1 Tax=Quercus lobata TaxID=97700 RepID=A0A7N2R591_QUELO